MKQFAIFLFVVFFASCKSSVPPNIIPPEKMQLLLWDLMQSDEIAVFYYPSDSVAKISIKATNYYQKVFAIHKITKNEFANSLKYYQDHPSSLKSVLDSLQHFAQAQLGKDSILQKHITPIPHDTIKRKLHVRPNPL